MRYWYPARAYAGRWDVRPDATIPRVRVGAEHQDATPLQPPAPIRHQARYGFTVAREVATAALRPSASVDGDARRSYVDDVSLDGCENFDERASGAITGSSEGDVSSIDSVGDDSVGCTHFNEVALLELTVAEIDPDGDARRIIPSHESNHDGCDKNKSKRADEPHG